GSLELDTLSFAAFYGFQGKVIAVAACGKDPLVSHASELLRLNKFPTIEEIRGGKDIMSVAL
ncbi:hypothetical protein HDU76_009964, partial [Blyttiomyces sp. JEL0837]